MCAAAPADSEREATLQEEEPVKDDTTIPRPDDASAPLEDEDIDELAGGLIFGHGQTSPTEIDTSKGLR